MTVSHDVIIVGGGPVGMGLAIDLGQRGVRVAVVERYPEPQLVPKGQNMTQRTLETIDSWGCEPQMRAARITPRDIATGGLVTYGTLLSDYSYGWLQREKVDPYYGQKPDRMPQYCTERVLRQRAAELETVDLHYGWTGTSLSQDADGVTITAKAREGDGELSLRGRYAVGCDGSKSFLRTAAGITQTTADHEKKMVLLVFKSPELHQLLGERYPPHALYNALAPELEGYWRFLGRVDGDSEWFYHAPVPKDATAENTDFEAHMHAAAGRPFALDITYTGFWDLRFALADTYRKGRVMIAGDACHSHPPYGGYGINTGFEDARNLGWKLGAVLAGWAGPHLLDSYDRERRPVFASTSRDFIQRFIEEDKDFLANNDPTTNPDGFARAWAARNDAAAEVHAFSPNYEGSPIVGGAGTPGARGEHAFRARAGHHFAPRRLSDGRTTYQALGSGFTLFDFSGGTIAEAVTAQGDALKLPIGVVTDTAEAERADYGAMGVLVRPDGFVAWAGDGAEAAANALVRASGHAS